MILAFGAFFAAGCMDQDPFGLSTRDIAGPYELEQWEDGVTYYIKGKSNVSNDAWGAIEGTVGQLGWTDDYIIVFQNECGAGEGWRIIDTKKKQVSPIVGKSRIDGDSTLAKIRVYPAADAWKKLK